MQLNVNTFTFWMINFNMGADRILPLYIYYIYFILIFFLGGGVAVVFSTVFNHIQSLNDQIYRRLRIKGVV